MGNLALLADTKTLLQISDASQDALLSLLIALTSSQIETYCGRVFAATDYVENKTANQRQIMQCDQWPINSVASITQNGATLVASQDYQTYSQYTRAGQIYRGDGWTGSQWVRGLTSDPYAGQYEYVVSYNAGYILPGGAPVTGIAALPQDLSMATMLMVAKTFGLSSQGNLGENIAMTKEGGLSYTFDNPAKIPSDLFQVVAGMSVQFASYLMPYRRWSHA